MSELKQTLINISEEKQAKIIPENLKVGVEAFGVTGNFTSDATATSQDILKDKTAYVNGEKVVGTLEKETTDNLKLTTANTIPVLSDAGTVQIKINGKNKFNQQDWYQTLQGVKQSSISYVYVDGYYWYRYNPKGIFNYQYMKGQFKENTQYTLSCKARKYSQDDTTSSSSGFMFKYTDGTDIRVYVKETLETYNLVLTSEEGKTIDYIMLPYNTDKSQLVRDIQLEEGTVATEYSGFKDGNTHTFILGNGDSFEMSLAVEQ